MKKVKSKKKVSTKKNTPDDLYNQKGGRTRKMMKINNLETSEEYKNLIPRPCEEDMLAIRDDIKKNGIEDPIIINKNNLVVDGYTRIDIARGLGHTEVPVKIKEFKNKEDEINFIIQANILRRHLRSVQKLGVGLKLLEFEKEKAKERQREHSGTAPGKTKTIMGREPTSESGAARDIVAKKIGVSSKTLQQGLKITKMIGGLDKEKSDVLKADWNKALAGKKSIKSVYKQAIKFEGKPENKPNTDRIKVKRLVEIKNKIDMINANDILAIENQKDRDMAIQTIEKMIAHLSKQMNKFKPESQ
ncbi:MAG: ParB N-terminal domain-containing protein [Thermoplasmatales archaeon]|nr:ParB N-terminal domain-containing protein [Thermoplasmatales archaeon]